MKLFGKYRSVREMLENEDPKTLAKVFPHGKPLTRRDLLKSGAIGFAGSIALPSLLERILLPGVANAQAVCAGKPAFVGLNLAGGYGALGNFVPLGANRDFIQTYNQFGLGSRSEAIARSTKVFGDALFFDGSQILAGIRATADASVLNNTTAGAILVRSNDDTASNTFDISAYVSKLEKGSILPNMGTQGGLTGIGQQPALSQSPPTPLQVSSLASIQNALTVNGSLGILSDAQKGKVFNLIDRLSSIEARRLASATGGDVLTQLVSQATGQNASLVANPNAGVNPVQDQLFGQQLNTIWSNANAQTLTNQGANSMENVFASMVYNTLNQNAGLSNLQIGGYDYHGQGRPTQDAKDLAAGRVIGQILASAAAMQKPVFIMVTSDGAVAAPAGSPAGAAFTGDSGGRGAITFYAYHPKQRPAMQNKSGAIDHQIGQAVGEASVDTDFFVSNDPGLAALAAFANFLSFSGGIGQFGSIAGSIWNTAQIEEVVRLRPVA